jgi:hypothetical protein
MNGNLQQEEHPPQPLEIQPDGTWILGEGAHRWIPSKNQIGDLRWVVERDLRKELGVPPKTALNKDKIEFHKRQLALLDLAKQAPRCEHVFSDGRCCKAPRVKKGKLCYAHTLMEEKRPQGWNLPPLEDPNDVMLWLMDALRGLLEGRISERTAGLMFYGLQLAMANSRLTTFRDVKFEEMVRTIKKPQRTQRNTKKEDFTAKGAKNAEEGRALPQRAQRNTEEEPQEDFTAKGAESAAQGGQDKGKAPQKDFAAESAEEEDLDKSEPSPVEGGLEPQNAKVNPGVKSAKSLFFGVEVGEGVADNRSVTPPSELPRKGSQSEILMVPEEVKHHAER